MGLDTFNKRSRPSIFRKLATEQFDLLLIGGGITGASVFRDAALRGMKVALVEAKDFASATSGRSSKLIHGGLRYLKSLGFRLAWESCHERNLHVRAQQAPGASHALSRATLQGAGRVARVDASGYGVVRGALRLPQLPASPVHE